MWLSGYYIRLDEGNYLFHVLFPSDFRSSSCCLLTWKANRANFFPSQRNLYSLSERSFGMGQLTHVRMPSTIPQYIEVGNDNVHKTLSNFLDCTLLQRSQYIFQCWFVSLYVFVLRSRPRPRFPKEARHIKLALTYAHPSSE